MARFVRLAGQSDVEAEHLQPPVVLNVPGGSKLGYSMAAALAPPPAARDDVLVSTPAPRSLLRPILEGALGIALLTLLLGAVADMTSSPPVAGSLSPAVGAILSSLLAFVGFQGVRSAAPMLLRVYALGSVLLVTAGLLLSLPGIVGHAQLHLAGIVMALGIVRLASNQRFLINAI